jgi:hypothetical protein
VAQAWLNGKQLGALWKSPFRLDVTGVLHSGVNQLEVEFTETRVNLMVGDKQPSAKPYAIATFERSNCTGQIRGGWTPGCSDRFGC